MNDEKKLEIRKRISSHDGMSKHRGKWVETKPQFRDNVSGLRWVLVDLSVPPLPPGVIQQWLLDLEDTATANGVLADMLVDATLELIDAGFNMDADLCVEARESRDGYRIAEALCDAWDSIKAAAPTEPGWYWFMKQEDPEFYPYNLHIHLRGPVWYDGTGGVVDPDKEFGAGEWGHRIPTNDELSGASETADDDDCWVQKLCDMGNNQCDFVINGVERCLRSHNHNGPHSKAPEGAGQ